MGPPTGGRDPDDLEAGFVVGPYRAIKLLGAGGMGAVYLAEQTEPIRRQVALKIVKPGLGSDEILRRFDTERQALALMDHPNIAKVLDAGSTREGRPYFVMEYVQGVPITAYCDQNHLSPVDRLRLFADVCRAIHHAHQKGVIHRDVKPSNILVGEREGKPVPMVIDFGIAKALDHQLMGETVFTQLGMLVGTPEYMSPEQASASPDIDTATDVYSLGVLLYELLTGVLPFDPKALRKRGYLEILRSIREDEPPRPTTRVRLMGGGATGVAQRRQTTLNGLVRQLRGDLEWITMRALEKDRARRYTSAAAMAEDIGRHLQHEPVTAGPPGRLYQLQKFLRRNRALAATAAAVVAALAVGLVLTYSQYRRAEGQRVLAEESATQAREARTRADQNASRAETAQSAAEQSRDAAETQRSRAETEAEANRQQLYDADMNRASNAWNDANVPLLRELLDRHLPGAGRRDLRSFEWFHLWRQAHGEVIEFPGAGPHVEFSRDGQWFGMVGAVGDSGDAGGPGDASLWNWRTWQKVASVPHMNGRDIGFSHDGKVFAVAAFNEAISIFETATQRKVTSIPISAQRLAFSPDGKLLAFVALGDPGTINVAYRVQTKVWDLESGKEKYTLPDTVATTSLAFSPDGKLLATVNGNPGTTRIWDMSTGGAAFPLAAPGLGSARRVAKFSPDGSLLVEAGAGGAVVWNMATRSVIVQMPLEQTMDIDFSHDGKLLAAAYADRRVMLFELPNPEVPNGRTIAAVRGLGQTADRVAFSPDDKFLVTGGSEFMTKVWRVDEVLAMRPVPARSTTQLSFTADGRYLLTAGVGGTSLVDMQDKKTARMFAHSFRATSISASKDGSVVAAAGGNPEGTITQLWRRGGETPLLSLQDKQRRATVRVTNTRAQSPAAVSPDGRYLAAGHEGGGTAVYETASGRQLAVFAPPEGKLTFPIPQVCNLCTISAAFSPDGSVLATVNMQGKVSLWEAGSWRLRVSLPFDEEHTALEYLAFSADSRRLATVDVERNVEIWDTRTGRRQAKLTGATNNPSCLGMTPDNRRAFTCVGRDILFWDLENNQQVGSIRVDSPIQSAAMSPDGRTLAVADSVARLYYLDATPTPAKRK